MLTASFLLTKESEGKGLTAEYRYLLLASKLANKTKVISVDNVRRKLAVFMGFLRVLCDWKCCVEKSIYLLLPLLLSV